MIVPIGASGDCASGRVCASAKKACPAIHSENAGATELKATRSHECRRRHVEMKLSNTSAIVAGAGPNSSADVMKNESATEMLAATDAIFTVNDVVGIATR